MFFYAAVFFTILIFECEMRRECIIVLLGIISSSTLTSLMHEQLLERQSNKLLLDTVSGTVGAGNFSYWQLGYAGPLLIELISVTGDADLYVADHMRPGYEVDQNDFSSATCGVDSVSIPDSFHRPLGVGVFGHWSHEQSDYKLFFYLDTPSVKRADEMKDLESEHKHDERSDTESRRKTDKKEYQHKTEEDKPRFVKFLNMLDMIFDIVFL